MKDNPYMWQPLTDFIFHIDADKKWGFERRTLIGAILIASLSIIMEMIG